jgi:hypothetical protein
MFVAGDADEPGELRPLKRLTALAKKAEKVPQY